MSDAEYAIPTNWTKTTVDKVLQPLDDGRLLHHGWSPQCERCPSPSDEQWGVLKTTAIQAGAFLEEQNKLLPSKLPARPHLEVKPGDILLTCAGPRGRCGVPCLVRSTRPRLMISGKMYRFRANEEVMSSRYLDAFLRSQQAQIAIDAMKTGISDSGVNLTHSRFKELAVPVAPLREQQRIAAKLDELLSDLDAGVAALERVKANLKRYRASVLKAAVEGRLTEEWRAKNRPQETGEKLLKRMLHERRRKWEEKQLAAFAAAGKQPPKNWRSRYKEPIAPDTSNLPILPGGWCLASVDQLAEVQGGIQKQPKRRPAANAYPFLRVANVLRDKLDLSDVHEIELFSGELEKLRLRVGDVLIVEGNGSRTEVGRSALWAGEIGDCVHQNHIIRVRFLAGTPQYFNAYWNSPTGQVRAQERSASTSGLYTLSVAKVSMLPFPLPPQMEQEEIAREIEPHFSLIEEAEKTVAHSLARAARLRQSILARAFEGKLVAQDPADEPAAVLLARIEQSRAAASAIRTKAKPHSDEFLRRAAIVSYTIKRLAPQPSFGRTQLEKTLHLAQSHLGIDLGLEFERYAAGPFDKSIYRLEGTANKSGWFTKKNRRRVGVTYHPGPKIDSMCQHATRLLGAKQADFDRLLDHIATMNTDDAELFSTAYAAWNDLLIDGRDCDDKSIIAEIYGWHELKTRFTSQQIRKRLEWMRSNNYVPTGQRQKTMPCRGHTRKSAIKGGARRS